MNFEQARYNMIEQQIRTWDVLDERVLDLFKDVPREDFVPSGFQQLAYSDIAVPLPHEQCMLPPREDARILQVINPKATDNVLEIGTGTGFLTLLLSKISHHVLTVDIYPEFTENAKKNLAPFNLKNVAFATFDASHSLPNPALYDVICITGSLSEMPQYYMKQLNISGRIFAIVGDAPAMHATCVTRVADNQWITETLFETVRPRLVNADKSKSFEF